MKEGNDRNGVGQYRKEEKSKWSYLTCAFELFAVGLQVGMMVVGRGQGNESLAGGLRGERASDQAHGNSLPFSSHVRYRC